MNESLQSPSKSSAILSLVWPGSLLVATALGLSRVVVATGANYAGDDAFILLTYARNLADGAGLVFQPGERLWGYTSPLQTLVLMLLESLSGDAARKTGLATALGVVQLGVACALVVTLTSGAHSKSSRALRSMAALALFLVPPLHLFPVLESTLVVTLQAGAAACALKARRHLCALLLALSCLARPDSVVFAVPVLLLLTVRRWDHKHAHEEPTVRQRCGPWITFALPGALWLIFALAYHGTVLPNTLGAKSGLVTFAAFWADAARWITHVSWPYEPGVASVWPWLLVLLQLSLIVRRLPPLSRWILVAHPWLLISAYALIGPPTDYKWEIYSAHFWFLARAATGLLLLFEGLADWLIARFGRPAHRDLLPLAGVAVQGLMIGAVLPATLSVYAEMQTGFYVGARYESYRQIARWFDGNARGTPSLAHYEVGTLGYFTKRTRIVDLGGLVSHRPASDLRQGPSLTAAILGAERPSHLLRPTGAPHRITVGDMTFRHVHDFPPYGYTPFSLYRRLDYRPGRQRNRSRTQEPPP